MSVRNKHPKFRKKDFIRTLYATRNYLCNYFGYEICPILLETRLSNGTIMSFFDYGKHYFVFYDYIKFKKIFDGCDYDTCLSYASAYMAHEMRHYYQHRQMKALKPREEKDIIEAWKNNDENPLLPNEVSDLEYYLQPLELDASLFEYVFVADRFNRALLDTISSTEHFNAMEKLYIKLYGESNETLFSDKVRELLD